MVLTNELPASRVSKFLNMRRPSHLRHTTPCHSYSRAGAKTHVLGQSLPIRRHTVSGVRSSSEATGGPLSMLYYHIIFFSFVVFPSSVIPTSILHSPISPDIISTLLFLDASPRGAVVGSRGHTAGFNHFPVRERYQSFQSAPISPEGLRSSDIPVTEATNRL